MLPIFTLECKRFKVQQNFVLPSEKSLNYVKPSSHCCSKHFSCAYNCHHYRHHCDQQTLLQKYLLKKKEAYSTNQLAQYRAFFTSYSLLFLNILSLTYPYLIIDRIYFLFLLLIIFHSRPDF